MRKETEMILVGNSRLTIISLKYGVPYYSFFVITILTSSIFMGLLSLGAMLYFAVKMITEFKKAVKQTVEEFE